MRPEPQPLQRDRRRNGGTRGVPFPRPPRILVSITLQADPSAWLRFMLHVLEMLQTGPWPWLEPMTNCNMSNTRQRHFLS